MHKQKSYLEKNGGLFYRGQAIVTQVTCDMSVSKVG